MAKILNLDKLSGNDERELNIGGKAYPVKPMSVEDFIETTLTAERLEGEKSIAKQIQATVKLIKRSVPTIDEQTLLQLSLEQLRAVTAFVRGEDPADIVEEREAGSGN
ncbi:hypothetical protein N5B55_05160 [Ralstonia pickettii]|uniref:hypothetical protein n=1 Tax=Ralstonia pickettii TaxID=329 RepID=UPI002714B70C|nr:hypothetical protein [Ralstonia pickettii]WKZ86344.1 hypothetical protein N5B55_05160 [Ralstonia pickettii]